MYIHATRMNSCTIFITEYMHTYYKTLSVSLSQSHTHKNWYWIPYTSKETDHRYENYTQDMWYDRAAADQVSHIFSKYVLCFVFCFGYSAALTVLFCLPLFTHVHSFSQSPKRTQFNPTSYIFSFDSIYHIITTTIKYATANTTNKMFVLYRVKQNITLLTWLWLKNKMVFVFLKEIRSSIVTWLAQTRQLWRISFLHKEFPFVDVLSSSH